MTRRFRSGFQGISTRSLGFLPARRRRELTLQHAWLRVAGDELARRARIVGLRRGLLEIEAADAEWVRTVRDVAPRLAGRFAAHYPELGVRKLRVREADRQTAVSAEAGEVGEADPAPESSAKPETRRTEGAADGDRLARVARRYLERGAGR